MPEYPEEPRVIKLFDGLRLDERATSQLLLAGGNQYKMRPVLDAIKIQYPAGMSITGLPNKLSKKNLACHNKRQTRSTRTRSSWHAAAEDWDDDDDEWYYENAEAYMTEEHYEPENDQATEAEPMHEDIIYDEENYDGDANAETVAGNSANSQDADLSAVVEALTVTSRRLAELTKSRGYYKQEKFKGKSNGKGKSHKGSKGSPQGKSFEKGKSRGKGRGKPSPTPT